MRALLFTVLAGFAAGCGAGSGGVRSPEAEQRGAAQESDILIEISLSDATVDQVMRAFSLASGSTVIVDPAAQAVASCARLSVFTPRPVRAEQLLTLVGQALSGSGLRLEGTAGGAILRRDPSVAIPPGCEQGPGAPRVSDEVVQKVLSGIREVSPEEHEITREALNLLFEDPTVLSSTARILPYEQGGQVVGFKLYAVRRGSVAGALGFRNGDLVTKVGGHSMTTPDQALQAYADLQGADQATVEVIRLEKQVLLRYRLIDTPSEAASGSE